MMYRGHTRVGPIMPQYNFAVGKTLDIGIIVVFDGKISSPDILACNRSIHVRLKVFYHSLDV